MRNLIICSLALALITLSFTEAVTTPSSHPSNHYTPKPPRCPYPSDVITFLPFDGDCSRYWECYKGNSYLFQCPGGLWWHQTISVCDYPGDYCAQN
ncbi:hypothetical protein TcasGA2_TC032296 [Tribolium castaneum]|uniref:Chitin-binding type-2 domain-containing protein n=1 Tax=Tribolium castaneum TaxID=7070 RepID=A0A139WMA5_TRICA|nr:PREDICTED: peritrophin-1-like [Tribolium castaneum]KYB28955.1 hypothetical protein TcasGA2_TC032296 [Tribolium castaneum]|eukprot:XP_015833016.1 PREDICTED: peritrophin-1-like [Tribolium castaneum]